MSHNDLFLEEAVLDDMAGDLDRLEMPMSKKAFQLVGGVASVIVALVFIRVIFLGGIKSDFYKNRALLNAGQIDMIRAERGIIYDRNENPLVRNNPSFRASLVLIDFLKLSDNEKKSIIDSISSVLQINSDEITKKINESDIKSQNAVLLAKDLKVEQIIRLKDLNISLLKIEDDYKREYTLGLAFSHLLGYTGLASQEELLNQDEESDTFLNDIVGKTGIELQYNNELKGETGRFINYRNAKGEIIEKKVDKKAKSGNKIYLSIDADLQKVFYNRLSGQINSLGSKAGVGIAMNPQTGEILALVNFPSYDNNNITSNDLLSSLRPLFNRAVSGNYTPASTIKPLHAFAALKENVVTTQTKVFSSGKLEIPNPYFPDQPSIFPDWKANGWTDVYSALAKSSNIYFYEITGGFGDIKGVGIYKLKEYWQKFGLGKKTGIDLPSEASGFLPDPETKEQAGGDEWRLGDTYHVGIGQGDLTVTPIQLLNYICVLANGGKIMEPHVMKKIVNENGEIIKENQPKILSDFSNEIDTINEIRKGMIDGVEKDYGTSHMLASLPISIAAKTGSSQVENKAKINAFFVGYTPTDNPELAILVLIENAREGSMNSVPVAYDVFNWYYNNRIMNKEL